MCQHVQSEYIISNGKKSIENWKVLPKKSFIIFV